MSIEAKLLYGLMLDRMGLSVRNGWMDEQQRVYIYFTLEDSMAMMGCGHNKAIKLFAALEQIGLIERRKQGQGRPARIYVKNFTLAPASEQADNPEPPQPAEDGQTSSLGKSALPAIQGAETSFSGKPTPPGAGSLEFPEADANKTDRNKTEWNDTESSPSSSPPAPPKRRPKVDRKGQLGAYRTILRENISYDLLLRDYGCDPELIDGYVELMAEVCSSTRKTIRVNQEELPTELVRSLELSVQQVKQEFQIEFNSTIDDFLESIYLAGANLGGTKIESHARCIERSNQMLKLLNNAVELLRTRHKNGEAYYWLLYYTYLSPRQPGNAEEIIE